MQKVSFLKRVLGDILGEFLGDCLILLNCLPGVHVAAVDPRALVAHVVGVVVAEHDAPLPVLNRIMAMDIGYIHHIRSL